MAFEFFTKDEVMLALDVLYSSENGRVSADSDEMLDLSALLNRLPVHSTENRRANFRNPHGVANQLQLLQTSLRTGKRCSNVGLLFYNTAFEFEGRHDELHRIAEAIRRNEDCFDSCFGGQGEVAGFPEGILLGHLHRVVETRDGVKVKLADHCEVCNLKPELYYKSCGGLLQVHLTVPPTELDGNKHYPSEKFITVCPNCHAALHRIRPWRGKSDCGDILS